MLPRSIRVVVFVFLCGLPLAWTHAHEGHGRAASAEFDLNVPRRPSPEARKNLGVEIEVASLRPIAEVLWLSGVVVLDPDRRAIVAPRTAGVVTRVSKRIGDTVHAGELVGTVESPERARAMYDLRKLEVELSEAKVGIALAEGEARTAEAALRATTTSRDFATKALERATALLDGASSTREREERANAVATLDATLAGHDATLQGARDRAAAMRLKLDAIEVSRDALASIFNLDAAPAKDAAPSGVVELRAPRDGIVLRADATVGEWLEAGTPFCEIADLAMLRVDGRLPERELARLSLRAGAAARIWLDRGSHDAAPLTEGSVRFIGPRIDEVSRSAQIAIDVRNTDEGLRIGQYVEIAISLDERAPSLAVPREAVVELGSLAFVYVENGDEFVKQDVALGRRDDRHVEITAGLAPGDRVVVRGGFALTQLRPEGVAEPTGEPGH